MIGASNSHDCLVRGSVRDGSPRYPLPRTTSSMPSVSSHRAAATPPILSPSCAMRLTGAPERRGVLDSGTHNETYLHSGEVPVVGGQVS